MGKHKHLWKYKHVQESHPDDRVGRTCRAVVRPHDAQTLGQHLQKKKHFEVMHSKIVLFRKYTQLAQLSEKSDLLPKLSICKTAGLFCFVCSIETNGST